VCVCSEKAVSLAVGWYTAAALDSVADPEDRASGGEGDLGAVPPSGGAKPPLWVLGGGLAPH